MNTWKSCTSKAAKLAGGVAIDTFENVILFSLAFILEDLALVSKIV